MRVIIFALLLSLMPNLVSAELSSTNEANFLPMTAIPQFDFTFGTLKVKSNNIDKSRLAFKKGSTVYSLVLDNETDVDTPKFQIDAMAFTNNGVILGLFEADGRHAWIFYFTFQNKAIQIKDVVKYSKLDNLNYDFYFDISPIDAPKSLLDLDNDGIYEIELDFYERKFRINLEINKSGLHIDYNSPIYLKHFNEAKSLGSELDDYQYREYLLSGILSSQLSLDNALNIVSKKDKTDKNNVPNVILQAVNIKKMADMYGVSDLLASYFSGQSEINIISDRITKNKQDPSEIMFAIFELERALNQAQLDEVAFSEFSLFFSGNITLDDFKASAKNTLVATDSDINSVLKNIRGLDAVIHKAPKFRLQPFTINKATKKIEE